jgi:hypothetical protein
VLPDIRERQALKTDAVFDRAGWFWRNQFFGSSLSNGREMAMTQERNKADNSSSIRKFGKVLRGGWLALRGQKQGPDVDSRASYLRLCEQIRVKLPMFVTEEAQLSFGDWDVREMLVWADPECLSLLKRLAEHPATPICILNQLACCSHGDVRVSVADNRNTPLSTMWLLVKDRDEDMRYAMAENHNLPSSILSELAEDSNPFVKHRAEKTLRRITASEFSVRSINGGSGSRCGVGNSISDQGKTAHLRKMLSNLINKTWNGFGLYLVTANSR